MRWLSEDLADRGVERLMVEGGGVVHTQFLADDLVDELQLVVAPFFVGDSSAPRFVSDARFGTRGGAPRSAGAPHRRRGVRATRFRPGSGTTNGGAGQPPAGDGPNAVRKRSRNAFTADRRLRVGRRAPSCQPHAAMRSSGGGRGR